MTSISRYGDKNGRSSDYDSGGVRQARYARIYSTLHDRDAIHIFRSYLEQVCLGKRVLHVDAGAGLLAIIAAQAGAATVYGAEDDEDLLEIAAQNVDHCGFYNIHLFNEHIRDITLRELDDQPVDVVVTDNHATWQVSGPQIKRLNYVNHKLAAHDVVHVPECISNYVELVESQYVFENVVEYRSHYYELDERSRPRSLSTPFLVHTLDLSQINLQRFKRTFRIKVTEKGTLNSLRLTSPLLFDETTTHSPHNRLMAPVIVPLEDDLPVYPEDIIEVSVNYKLNSRWQDFDCEAAIVG